MQYSPFVHTSIQPFLPQIGILLFMTLTMWWPLSRVKNRWGENFDKISWRKAHAKEILVYSFLENLLHVGPLRTLFFYTFPILIYSHITPGAWIVSLLYGIMFASSNGRMFRWKANYAQLDDARSFGGLIDDFKSDNVAEELERIQKKHPRLMFRRMWKSMLSAFIEGFTLCAISIWSQSILTMYLITVLVMPVSVILTFLVAGIFMRGASVHDLLENKWLQHTLPSQKEPS